MRFAKSILVILFSILGALTTARATTQIHIDLTTQTMHVDSSSGSYTWPVSTARSGYSTPRGSYAPTGLQRMHYSKKYHMSPMPYSIFFRGGYAIHGTYATGALGRPASHGCVRLSPAHAAQLYHLVQTEGGSISITGAPPGPTRFAAANRHARMMLASHQRRGHAEALAYAPPHHRHFLGVRGWQADPFYSPYPYNYGGF
ncbi:MAG: L,D-transpeptidase [Rhodoblastus sp.]|uniref:L,D-transpeptidase n=1 Tax=Rhodoblastus sp. TaxID=1962975 RepID=UPI003F990483